MSNEQKQNQEVKKAERKAKGQKRAATFKVTRKQGSKRVFTAVNKRAKRLTADLHGDITGDALRIISKTYRVLESPSLKKISL